MDELCGRIVKNCRLIIRHPPAGGPEAVGVVRIGENATPIKKAARRRPGKPANRRTGEPDYLKV
jgi:hypothetical protein